MGPSGAGKSTLLNILTGYKWVLVLNYLPPQKLQKYSPISTKNHQGHEGKTLTQLITLIIPEITPEEPVKAFSCKPQTIINAALHLRTSSDVFTRKSTKIPLISYSRMLCTKNVARPWMVARNLFKRLLKDVRKYFRRIPARRAGISQFYAIRKLDLLRKCYVKVHIKTSNVFDPVK